jgi:hypothetical protein
LSLEETFNAAKDNTSLAQTEKDNADAAVTGDNSNDNLVRQSNAIQSLAAAVAAQAPHETAFNNALQDQIDAGVALSNANDTLSNANEAYSTANAPKNTAFIARTAANQAVINSENQIESDKGVLLTAQTALTTALDAITDLGGDNSLTSAEQSTITSNAEASATLAIIPPGAPPTA